jgi:hypothetical protein
MMPCHGFNGIVDQWKTSTHYIGAIENLEEEASWTNPNAACGNCHATDGLPTRLAGQYVISGADAGPVNAANGQLSYNKADASAEIGYGGKAAMAIIGCTTCHDAVTNDPHVTGGNYVKGDFKLRVPSGANDQAFIEKSPVATPFTGTPAGKMGVSNTCVACHKSRKDVTNLIKASNPITSAYWGPHEGPHADVFSGKGGYHFKDNNGVELTYTNSTHQVGTCGTCHMPKVALNGNYPDHSFRPQLSTCVGSGCHGSDATLKADMNLSRGNYNQAMAVVQAAMNAKGWLQRAGNVALSGTELTDNQFHLDRSRSGVTLTANEAGALYNYFIIARGGAMYTHNSVYTKQLLLDSYRAVTGTASDTLPGIGARP